MRSLVALLVLAPSVASAQMLEMYLDSPWTAWSSSAAHLIAAQPLKRDSLTGVLEAIPGQRVAIGTLNFRSLSIRVNFPGQKSTPMKVAGVRLLHSAKGAGWQMPEHPVNVVFPVELVVPAGRSLGCVYSMPLTGTATLKCEVASNVVSGEVLR